MLVQTTVAYFLCTNCFLKHLYNTLARIARPLFQPSSLLELQELGRA